MYGIYQCPCRSARSINNVYYYKCVDFVHTYSLSEVIALFITDREIQSTALEALYLVEHLTLNGCSPNTVAEIEHLQLNYSVLEESTRRAVLGSNLLTSIILERNGSLDSLSEDFLYNFVRNNIVGQTATYSSFVVLEPEVYPKHQSFAPMATTKSGTIETLDLSLSYDYRSSDSYTVLKTKNWDNITETKTKKQIW